MLTLLYIVIVLSISSNNAARILAVIPFPSISHQVVFRPLTQELASRGHEVTVITTDPAFPKGKTPSNLTEIDVHDLSYKIWKENMIKSVKRGHQDNLEGQIEAYLPTILEIVIKILQDDEIQRTIGDKTKKFDLLILEACSRPTLVFSHIYKVPVIQVSSFGAMPGNLQAVGAPEHPILYPNPLRQRLNNLTIRDKITEVYNYYLIKQIFRNYEKVETKMFRKYFDPKTPTVAELYNNVHMLFLNVHPVFEGIRPVPPAVVFMGGLHQNPVKELPTDLKSYLDGSKQGVIYISFGTNVPTARLQLDKVQTLLKVFSQLPYNVLWKWDADELPGRTDNIRISKWLPQSDLLRHPNIKLFITQGGLQSTDEAITAGVPLIGIPMLGDQWCNVERYEYHKIGVKIDMEALNEEQLKNAIITVIGDERYRRNIVRLRTLMYDQPQRPLERAVWWTEHVLRHGGARHLRAPAANMSWAQYLELELFLTLLISLFTLVSLFILFFYFVIKSYVASKRKVKSA